jgi:hypothetical protein
VGCAHQRFPNPCNGAAISAIHGSSPSTSHQTQHHAHTISKTRGTPEGAQWVVRVPSSSTSGTGPRAAAAAAGGMTARRIARKDAHAFEGAVKRLLPRPRAHHHGRPAVELSAAGGVTRERNSVTHPNGVAGDERRLRDRSGAARCFFLRRAVYAMGERLVKYGGGRPDGCGRGVDLRILGWEDLTPHDMRGSRRYLGRVPKRVVRVALGEWR